MKNSNRYSQDPFNSEGFIVRNKSNEAKKKKGVSGEIYWLI